VESFNSRFRGKFLNIELFTSVQEAKLLAEQHRVELQHLHTAFGAPGAYAPGGHTAMESGLTTHQLSEELEQQRGARHNHSQQLPVGACGSTPSLMDQTTPNTEMPPSR
jgi:hypothetical protein